MNDQLEPPGDYDDWCARNETIDCEDCPFQHDCDGWSGDWQECELMRGTPLDDGYWDFEGSEDDDVPF